MPRRAAERPAAYTRTRHLERFFDLVSRSLPDRVDADYVGQRLGLSGGDVRAFLQSLRVLGLVDGLGRPTDRLREARSRERRPAALRAALGGAYPELVERWERSDGLTREAVEDHFKLEYGLGASSAAPAARLFLELWGGAQRAPPAAGVAEMASKGGEAASPALLDEGGEALPPEPISGHARATSALLPPPVPSELARALAGIVHVEVGRDWDADRINLVFDRLERLLDRLQKS